jgi:hypothetical protein
LLGAEEAGGARNALNKALIDCGNEEGASPVVALVI